MPPDPITPEDGITSPEQEIKSVFKTSSDNKIWQPGEMMTDAAWETCLEDSLHQANTGETLSIEDVRRQIEQLKAFQTHGT